jgi:hypothetical protein
MLTEGHLEHSFRLPPWAPSAGHWLFLPGSAPAHSVAPCICHASRRELMYLLTRQPFLYHRKMTIHWMQCLFKRRVKAIKVKKMSFRIAKWLTQGYRLVKSRRAVNIYGLVEWKSWCLCSVRIAYAIVHYHHPFGGSLRQCWEIQTYFKIKVFAKSSWAVF